MSLISIIVPIYKTEKYLPRCIESILAQTYKNIELILVDDGSPDDSGKICDDYAKKDVRIRVVHKENGGLSSARNAGLDVATGDLISFIDSDDFVSSVMIQTMLEKLQAEQADLCICGFQYTDENGTFLPQSTEGVITDGVMDRKTAFERLDGHYVIACNKLYKRELFADLRFAVGRIHEDEFIMHRVFGKCNSIVTVSDRLYFYVQQPGSIMNASFTIRRLDGARALYDRYLFFRERGENELARKALKKSYILLMTCLQRLPYRENKKEYKDIVKQVYRALGHDLRKIKMILWILRKQVKELLGS